MPVQAGAAFSRGGVAPRVLCETMNVPFRAVLSPCIGVCTLDEEGSCLGCHRTAGEIALWSQMDDDERLHLMEHVLPEREAQRT